MPNILALHSEAFRYFEVFDRNEITFLEKLLLERGLKYYVHLHN